MRRLILAAGLAAAAALPAAAGEPTEDITPDFVANIARGHGSAVLEKTQSGKPMILGRIDGRSYAIFLIDCEKGPSCALVQFATQFAADNPDSAKINEWNAEKRFGKVSLTPDRKVRIMQTFVSGEGLPLKTLERYFVFWRLVMKEAPPFIGAK